MSLSLEKEREIYYQGIKVYELVRVLKPEFWSSLGPCASPPRPVQGHSSSLLWVPRFLADPARSTGKSGSASRPKLSPHTGDSACSLSKVCWPSWEIWPIVYGVIQKFNLNFKKSLLLSRSSECIRSGRTQQILRSGSSGHFAPRICFLLVLQESVKAQEGAWPPGDGAELLQAAEMPLL